MNFGRSVHAPRYIHSTIQSTQSDVEISRTVALSCAHSTAQHSTAQHSTVQREPDSKIEVASNTICGDEGMRDEIGEKSVQFSDFNHHQAQRDQEEKKKKGSHGTTTRQIQEAKEEKFNVNRLGQSPRPI